MAIPSEAEYEELYASTLTPITSRLEQLLKELLASQPRIDRISARAKAPRKFLEKAAKANKDGTPKYSDPLGQIQDLIGARVIVYYQDDVEPLRQLITRYWRVLEDISKVPEDAWEFGYFGHHFVLVLPKESVPKEVELRNAPGCFELQIKTLFQHAWAEAYHDLGYKPKRGLTLDQVRRFAFTSAQAWGADRHFQDLFQELHATKENGR